MPDRALLEALTPPQGSLPFWLIDYDGTLTPIVRRPEDAQLSKQHQGILADFVPRQALPVIIVSGRSVDQLLSLAPGLKELGVWLIGLHGGQWYEPKLDTWHRHPDEALTRRLHAWLRQLGQGSMETTHVTAAIAHAGYKHVEVEDKGHSVAFHTRGMSEETQVVRFRQWLSEQAAPLLVTPETGVNPFKLQIGKAVLELVPAAHTKGTAARELIKRFSSAGNMPIFPIAVGDDVTDEAMIAVAQQEGGIGVHIGEPKLAGGTQTQAHLQIESYVDLYRILGKVVRL